MLDIKQIRKDFKTLEEKLKRKDPTVSLEPILSLDEEIRSLKTEVEKLKSERNQISQEIGEKKRSKENVDDLLHRKPWRRDP
jgi:seryl-tRNA synthetase